MGRSDKVEKEGQRATSAPPASSDAAAAALGNLQTAAALETLLKSAQGVAAQSAQLPSEAQQLLMAGGFDPLQALARNPALLSRLTKNALPRSAPVSSLLPPLPPEGLSPQSLLALQAQLGSVGAANPAALLGAGVAGTLAGPSVHGATDMAALQQLLAVQAAAATPKTSVASSIAGSVTPDMQSWPLERLEQHVNLLNQLKQPVPESVAVLLADARRKEAKKTAKRLANRKSASSSRARKKALVQEMTELNARLKRQAQILALLPDLVITINVDGVVTFCSAQVERVLHHKIEDIVGAQLSDLLVPTSRDKLNRLVAQLVESEQLATLGVAAVDTTGVANESGNDTEQALGNASNMDSAGAAAGAENSSEVAVVSEPSFPLSVVKVKAKEGASDDIDNSDNSASVPPSKGPSSLTQESIPRSPTASSLGNSGSDDAKNAATGKDGKKKNLPSSDTSNSSSLSTAAKKVQKANQNLEKNVRAHNKKMKKKGCPSYRDDVTGADVTANNASARLSSLQHRPESSSEEDSGYRESNDSREETSSSASDSSASNRRRKPIAPTCTVCLVRKDLTTIWCEVTSSIRTVETNRDGTGSEGGSEDGKSRKSGNKVGTKSEEGSAPSEPEIPPEKELLLCLRPIRDGDDKMDEKLRFGGLRKKKLAPGSPARSDTTNTKPPKKRRPDAEDLEEEPPTKKASATPQEGKVDTEVAESLMAMNKQSDA